MERHAWTLLPFGWQRWEYVYCCVQPRFAKPNHCLRVDSTKGFLSVDRRSSSIHYGQSVFLLTIFKTNSHPKSFSKWHSLYHQVPNSMTFTMLLNQYKITCSNLVSYLTQNWIIMLTFICQIFIFFHFSHKVVVNVRMYQAICIISWKTKDSTIWIWKTLRNVALFTMTGERQLKLEQDKMLLVKHRLLNLACKSSLNSLIHQLTMFYFGHFYKLSRMLLSVW